MHDPRIPSRIAVPAVVLLLAAGLRLWGLALPADAVLGRAVLRVRRRGVSGRRDRTADRGRSSAVKIADEGTWVHPPLGKWIIALLGVGPIGQRSIGWRLPPAVFGIAGVALLYLLALRLWRSVWWAGFAALLLALDGLHIVQSRIAMLDIFLTTFITAAVLFLVLDRERMDVGAGHPADGRGSIASSARRIRFWAGVFLGCRGRDEMVGRVRAAVRGWSLRGLGVHRRPARRAAPRSRPSGRSSPRSSSSRSCVYLAELRRVLLSARVRRPRLPDAADSAMLHYQQAHLAVQPENSQPVDLAAPAASRSGTSGRGARRRRSSSIVALGNPALWWGFLAAAAGRCWCRSFADRRGRTRSSSAATRRCSSRGSWSGRTQFIWYMLPAVPFMCLCVVGDAPAAAVERSATALAPSVFARSSTLVAAIAFLPVWTGGGVPTLGLEPSAGSPAGRSDGGNEKRAAPKGRPFFERWCRSCDLGPARRSVRSATVGTGARRAAAAWPYFVPAAESSEMQKQMPDADMRAAAHVRRR